MPLLTSPEAGSPMLATIGTPVTLLVLDKPSEGLKLAKSLCIESNATRLLVLLGRVTTRVLAP